MYKFIKMREIDNEFDVSEIEFRIDTVNRDTLLEEFEHFLKACGYHINGTLDIVEDE